MKIIISFITLILVSQSWAQVAATAAQDNAFQDDDASELSSIESELEKQKTPVRQSEASPDNGAATAASPEFQSLGRLSPFNEVTILQKKLLPKSKRFMFSLGGSTATNDAFFLTLGVAARAAYNFNETWGVEAQYMAFTTSEREATKDLRTANQTSTDSLVYTDSYYGLDLMWTPIYGKMAMLNRTIIPFDLFFALGLGQTKLKSGANAGTVRVGTGQIFALSKSTAFRWDFGVNSFSATTSSRTDTFNNLFLTLGFSFFYPEVKYR